MREDDASSNFIVVEFIFLSIHLNRFDNLQCKIKFKIIVNVTTRERENYI
jgi:hypothetical protein